MMTMVVVDYMCVGLAAGRRVKRIKPHCNRFAQLYIVYCKVCIII